MIQSGHAIVGKAARHGAENGHLIGRRGPRLFVALHLLAHIALCVLRAFAVELVDRNKVGKIEHVNFFELAGGAKFWRHDIQRYVHVRHDGSVALADA